ncbi:SA1362 family protein [Massilibacterium senegalense]|uniref:SA1362 family protein n=1 Tax=Massilibacterium senegalense TaxID=1632858 RepID=UPI000785FB7B|nr:SA1362 family protein [Massilibacterium senegalense]
MNRRSAFLLYVIVMLLAIIGFGYQVITNPKQLVITLITFSIVGVILFFIFKKIVNAQMNGPRNSEQAAYKKAVKQSKQLHGTKDEKKSVTTKPNSMLHPFKTSNKNKPLRHRKDVPFTVIEGNKGKKNKKNQASN